MLGKNNYQLQNILKLNFMSKTSPENTSISSRVFFIHNNPVFKPGFILKAQYKVRDYDSAVDDMLQGTCIISSGNLCYMKTRDHYPFSNRGLRQEHYFRDTSQVLFWSRSSTSS